MKEITINRNFKDRVFCMLFSEPKNALQLYNALNDTNYTDTMDLKINTLDNAIFLKMKNDVSFLINNFMNLYEQQSTSLRTKGKLLSDKFSKNSHTKGRCVV
ncbi:MAG: hypothetical protein PHD70_13960 [Anaerostipes sp.]|nr:hypothetical protein [Anaerostipes sp.]